MDPVNTDLIKTKSGDDDAFARLLAQYSPLISALAGEFSKTCPSVDMNVEDLKQEAAIALYFAALSYREEADVTFGYYAKVCIKNRLLDYMKRSAARVIFQTLSDFTDDCFNGEHNAPASTDEEPLNVIISNENFDALRRNIRDILTENEYKVFILTSDGLSPKAAAAVMGKSVKSVYDTLQRVRRKLKNLAK